MSAAPPGLAGLAELQELFFRAVRLDPAPPAVDHAFVGRGALSGRDRMAIYRRMYWYRQVDALFDTFPRTARVLGAERFTKLACAYIARHPSEAPALERLGRKLDAYLDELRTDASVVGLATIERLRLEALLGADPRGKVRASDVDPARFAGSKLAFAPSLALGHVPRGAFALFARTDEERALAAQPAVEPLPPPGATCLAAAYRDGLRVQHLALDDDEAEALLAARAGANVGRVCDAFEPSPDPASRAFGVLKAWLDRGWVEAITSEES